MQLRRVIILFNPIAGGGRAAASAEALRQAIAARGHAAEPVATQREHAESWLPPLLAGRDVVVVVGGDGAVRLALDAVADAKVALLHYPSGTENLFARHFGMRADATQVCDAIERGQVVPIDLGTLNGSPFAIMASVGFDASVIREVDARRRGSISYWSYAPAILDQWQRWRAADVTVRIDGGAPRHLGRGNLIVANLPCYGLGIDPVRAADPTDGLLDAIFLPAERGSGALWWAMRLWWNAANHHPDEDVEGAVRIRARDLLVTTDVPSEWQCDGDAASAEGESPTESRLGVRSACLPVLLPLARGRPVGPPRPPAVSKPR